MKPANFVVSALAVVLLGTVGLAADEPAKPASAENARSSQGGQGASASERTAKAQPRASRLTKPWRDLGSLTEEQKKQIADIHRKAVQDKNVIEEREKADIMALLNDQQKSELKSMLDKEAAERKAKSGTKPAARGAAAGANDATDAANTASGSAGKIGVADSKQAKTKTTDDKEATATPAK